MDQAHRNPGKDFRMMAAASISRWCLLALLLAATNRQPILAQSTNSDASEYFRTTSVFEVLEGKADPETSVPKTRLPSWDDQQVTSASPLISSHEFSAPQFSASQLASSACCRPVHEVLPAGLLYRSYIASPHEPRMSSTLLYDVSAKAFRWDSTLGGRFGVYRRNAPPNLNLDAWQIDVEGAVMVRLDPEEKMDLESSDYRFGLIWTGRRDNIGFKAGYYHISSHVGDEFLIKNPTFERINYVRESLIVGTFLQATPEVKVYIEAAYGVVATGGSKPFHLQYGAEYVRLASRPNRPAPFAAFNFLHRQEMDYQAGITLMTGWQWTGVNSGHSLRLGFQYFNGPTNQFEFLDRYDNQAGMGVWFDY